MKLLLTLLVLTYLTVINASLSVFTEFTLSGDGCTAGDSDTAEIDQCVKVCSSNFYGKIKYDFTNNIYNASLYTEDSCSTLANSDTFNCGSNEEVGSWTIVCSEEVEVVQYTSFTLNSTQCQDTNDTIFEASINTCTPVCNDFYAEVTQIEGDVNGYKLIISSDAKCDSTEQTVNFVCSSELVAVDLGTIKCNEESNSSILSFSAILLAVVLLFNLLL